MPDEKSCGLVIFRNPTTQGLGAPTDRRLYLLLHYEENHWDFPKGHVEEGESEHETAIRETEEETGISDLEFVFGFREPIEYFYKRDGKNMHKEVIFFLARTDSDEVQLSREHVGFEWLPYDEALERLTYKTAKEILQKAERYL